MGFFKNPVTPNLSGLYASRPPANYFPDGTMFYATDSRATFVQYGGSWTCINPSSLFEMDSARLSGAWVPKISSAGFVGNGALAGETIATTGPSNTQLDGTNAIPFHSQRLGTGATISTPAYVMSSAFTINQVLPVCVTSIFEGGSLGGLTSYRMWIGALNAATISADTLAAKGFGIRYSTTAGDSTLKFCAFDGTTQQVVDTGVTFTPGNLYHVAMWTNPAASKLYCLVTDWTSGGSVVGNGVVSITQALTDQTRTATLGAGVFNLAAANKVLDIGQLKMSIGDVPPMFADKA